MNDTLRYTARDPVHRRWHHNEITFGLLYAFSENSFCRCRDDEVVHGKRALIEKNAGRRLAPARDPCARSHALMWTHPGKKLPVHGRRIRPASRMVA